MRLLDLLAGFVITAALNPVFGIFLVLQLFWLIPAALFLQGDTVNLLTWTPAILPSWILPVFFILMAAVTALDILVSVEIPLRKLMPFKLFSVNILLIIANFNLGLIGVSRFTEFQLNVFPLITSEFAIPLGWIYIILGAASLYLFFRLPLFISRG